MRIKSGNSQKSVIVSISLLCFVVLGPGLGSVIDCQAQERPQRVAPDRASDEPRVTRAIAEVKEDYKISPGDVIEIHIDRAPELSGSFRVSTSGANIVPIEGRRPI